MPASVMKSRVTCLFIFVILIALVGGLAENGQGQQARGRNSVQTQTSSKEDKPGRRVDDPTEAQDLNRELWRFARHTPYKQILPYVAAAQRRSRNNQPSGVELPDGRRIAPAGKQVEVGRLPFEAVPFAGKLVVLNTGYYYKEPQEVSIVDTESAEVVKTLKIHSLFPSAVVGLDGDLYVSGGFDQKVFRVDHQFNLTRDYPVRGFTGGIAPIDSQHLAVGYMAVKNNKGVYLNGRLAILNTTSGQIEKEIDLGYFPFAVRVVNEKIFVTLLGENKLLVYSQQLELIKSIPVGVTPQEMCTDGRQLYVVNGGSDDLSVVDVQSNQLESHISLAAKGSSFGVAPTSCAVDGGRLYITMAGSNSVEVIDARTRKSLSHIRAGWYPTRVLFDENKLIVVSAKGIRPRRPNPNGPRPAPGSKRTEYVLNLLKGTVAVIPKSEVETASDPATGSPVFDKGRIASSIKHVFYIIKENRTYDQVLGDLGRGNGDPKLTMFGESVTPIQHQLAREFVTLDNFFVNGEISVLGHSFTTSGYASPFIEWLGNVSYSERWKGYPFATVPATMSPVYLWDLLDEKKIDYRIYGENPFLFTRAYRIFSEMYGPESELARRAGLA